jgi:hypothetical protein
VLNPQKPITVCDAKSDAAVRHGLTGRSRTQEQRLRTARMSATFPAHGLERQAAKIENSPPNELTTSRSVVNNNQSMDIQAMQSMDWLFKKERIYLLAQFWQQVGLFPYYFFRVSKHEMSSPKIIRGLRKLSNQEILYFIASPLL